MRSKRIGIINTNQSVPKKNKIVQNKNQAPPEASESPSELKPGKTSRARASDESKKRPVTSQEKCACAKSQGHDASRGGNNGATVR